MRLLRGLATLALLLATTSRPLRAQPPGGSQLPREENACIKCHGEEDRWAGEQRRLFISADVVSRDVHCQKGVNCHDCHGGDPGTTDVPTAHATVVPSTSDALPFRSAPRDVRQRCGACHVRELRALRRSVHAHAGEVIASDGARALLECGKCHGQKAHGMLPVRDHDSPVCCDKQIETCGSCHEDFLASYKQTVHGKGLLKSGLTVSAVCSDCHGAHGTYYAADRRSTLHRTNVASTCGKCHWFIEDRVRRGACVRNGMLGGSFEPKESHGKRKRSPSCTDCHQGHLLLDPASAPFHLQLANRCGNCHPKLSGAYAMSTHGELTELGYAPAADCADCHGAHDILGPGDPNSPVAAGPNRLATCRKCHVNAVSNFAMFDPHANHKNAEKYPLLHAVYVGMRGLFFFFFFFFIVHGFLWFVRAFVQTLIHGGHNTLVSGQYALVRFEKANRRVYGILFLAFFGLMITGLPLKYGKQSWAKWLAHALGGFESTSVFHHFFAAVAIGGCVVHLVWGIKKIRRRRAEGTCWRTILFGPDSLLPTFRDAKDMVRMGRWFLGLGPKPGFERWTYWEKFDYWGVYLTGGVIGLSGLLLWYPNVFCRFLPGQVLNVAKVIHTEIAVLAASFLFIFHYFNTHFRPEKFPMDLSAITGLVSEEHVRRNRPEYYERLVRTGQLEQLRRPAPSPMRLWGAFLTGMGVIGFGILLLALVLIASLGK